MVTTAEIAQGRAARRQRWRPGRVRCAASAAPTATQETQKPTQCGQVMPNAQASGSRSARARRAVTTGGNLSAVMSRVTRYAASAVTVSVSGSRVHGLMTIDGRNRGLPAEAILGAPGG